MKTPRTRQVLSATINCTGMAIIAERTPANDAATPAAMRGSANSTGTRNAELFTAPDALSVRTKLIQAPMPAPSTKREPRRSGSALKTVANRVPGVAPSGKNRRVSTTCIYIYYLKKKVLLPPAGNPPKILIEGFPIPADRLDQAVLSAAPRRLGFLILAAARWSQP